MDLNRSIDRFLASPSFSAARRESGRCCGSDPFLAGSPLV